MNCPNCGKEPVSVRDPFRFGGVGFKQTFKGYFRCKHCGTLLKQATEDGMFPKYKKTFWVYLLGYFILMFSAIWLVLFYFQVETLYGFSALLVLLIGMIGIMEVKVKPRFWVIEEVEKEDQRFVRKLTPKGWTIFLSFFMLVLLSVIALPWIPIGYYEIASVNPWITIAGMTIFLIVTIGGAFLILKRYSKLERQSVRGD